jgi:phosphatidylglycerophosphate synthase
MTFRDRAQKFLHGMLQPLVILFIRLGITPNIVTTIGLILNLGVTIIFIIGAERGERSDLSYLAWAGGLILFAGLFDMIDGQVARIGKMSSRFGALYDSVLDRYSELFMFLGICYYLVSHHYFISSLTGFIAMIGSIMVSYTRARAEGLGIPCKDGLMQRPERVILIGTSLLLCGLITSYRGGSEQWIIKGWPFYPLESISIFVLPLSFVAIMANYTAFQRLRICYDYMNNKEGEIPDVPAK